ncbi:MAG: PilZ domain-containing protein [Bryobacteraceae bacterium]
MITNCQTSLSGFAQNGSDNGGHSALVGKAITTEPREKRQYSRVSTNKPAKMRQLFADADEPFPVRILDLSCAGMKLEVPVRLCPGESIQVFAPGLIVMGQVRYCRAVGLKFVAGLEYEDILRTCD